MISPGHDIVGYVQVFIIKIETRVQVYSRKAYRICVLPNRLLKVVLYKIMGRNTVQAPMTDGKVIVETTPRARISLNTST